MKITSLFIMMIVVMVGLAIFNAVLSYVTMESCKLLKKTPEIDRGILSKLYKSQKKTDKYPWSGPVESSRLVVIVVWIIFFIGLALIALGLFMTGRVQEFLFAFGICASILSVTANLTASLFAWFVMGRMHDEKKLLDNPLEEEKERAKKKRRKKFFGISIEI